MCYSKNRDYCHAKVSGDNALRLVRVPPVILSHYLKVATQRNGILGEGYFSGLFYGQAVISFPSNNELQEFLKDIRWDSCPPRHLEFRNLVEIPGLSAEEARARSPLGYNF